MDETQALDTMGTELLHKLWWSRMTEMIEHQTAACGCGLDEKNPKERCASCTPYAEKLDEVEVHLIRRGVKFGTGAV